MYIEEAVHMTSLVTKAFGFMRRAHASHKRKQGTPYAEHPEAVFNILTNEFEGPVSENMQIIALLHDTLEMGETEGAIAREFGSEVLNGVKLLTRQKGESFEDYAARLRTAPKEIRLVKAADRLHNLRDALLAGDPAWALEYVRETREHVLPFIDDAWFSTKLTEAISEIEESVSTSKTPRVVTLRNIRSGSNKFNLRVYIDEAGCLHIDGQDLGPVTASGGSEDGEYEYFKTIDAKYIPQVVTLLGGKPGDDILQLLAQNWSGERSFELERILGKSGIPIRVSVW